MLSVCGEVMSLMDLRMLVCGEVMSLMDLRMLVESRCGGGAIQSGILCLRVSY